MYESLSGRECKQARERESKSALSVPLQTHTTQPYAFLSLVTISITQHPSESIRDTYPHSHSHAHINARLCVRGTTALTAATAFVTLYVVARGTRGSNMSRAGMSFTGTVSSYRPSKPQRVLPYSQSTHTHARTLPSKMRSHCRVAFGSLAAFVAQSPT